MNRTIVYPVAGAKGGEADTWGDKLVKYIPAEVIAFYVPMYALVESAQPWAAWLVLGLGALGTLGYLRVFLVPPGPPRFYFYVLSVVAFAAWAVGTSSIGSRLWHMPTWAEEVTILAAVFLIPLTDELATMLTDKRRP